jgi:hypothetical protein
MKLSDILEENEPKKGTYAGVRYSPESIEAVQTFLKEHSIPNPVADDKIHTTLLYSRKFLPNYEPKGKLAKPMQAKFHQYDVWKTSPQDETQEKWNCLVMKLKCPELEALHKQYMDEHKATYDYPVYTPHVTLSYNIGDYDITKLPNFTAPLHITEEYGEELNLDWANTHGTK